MTTTAELNNGIIAELKQRMAEEAAALSAEAEPVAAQVRRRRPKKGMPDWSPWQEAPINLSHPTYWVDSIGYENEYRLLYAAPAQTEQIGGF